AGGGSERDAVPPRRVDGGRDGRRRPDRAACALLRVLAPAAAGRVPSGSAAVGRCARVSRERTEPEPVRARQPAGIAGRAVRARGGASLADRHTPRAGSEVGARAAGDAEIATLKGFALQVWGEPFRLAMRSERR